MKRGRWLEYEPNSRAVRVRPAREPIALDSIGGRAINILTAGDDEPVADGSSHSPFTEGLIKSA